MLRYFVKVFSPSRTALRALRSYGFDLFHPTVKPTADSRFCIDGLLHLEQVERLVLDGYQVLIEDESSKRARGPKQVVELDRWLAARKGK